ncbi:choice-of-anchor H family protein [Colwellia psychrerythraea]|uniref:Uncharacterized protein n=1 Tax=Colwellia psychrerythraea TaxID=28229 RepID=A0A099L357_COLPS|nr:choice-of-anchor H family protein [Colwellia psychrerythraea]KGJ96880.1 hypothetical protein GAB14E_1348 [Colwellia psychrerythraea]
MMNQFIKYLSRESFFKNAEELSPIILTSMQLVLMLALTLITVPSFAEQADIAKGDEKYSVTTDVIKSFSSGQSANAISKSSAEIILQQIKQRIKVGDSDQEQNKALAITRSAVNNQKRQKYRKLAAVNLAKYITTTPSSNNTSKSFTDGNFVIYEAYSQLIEDYDSDGYYQTFSVTFDADLITYNPHDEAVIYAELYLSENGGPWQHYYTTDNFVIHGESSDDEFEVYSTLSQGFNPNHYDVLIDIYEDGYANIVASYSSDDSNSLYALPLESSDYDVEYVEYYEEAYIHGGSYSLYGLLMMILTILVKYPNRNSYNFFKRGQITAISCCNGKAKLQS